MGYEWLFFPLRQTMLVTHSDTVDKATLMQASQLMGLDSRSQGPRTFKSFYSGEDWLCVLNCWTVELVYQE